MIALSWAYGRFYRAQTAFQHRCTQAYHLTIPINKILNVPLYFRVFTAPFRLLVFFVVLAYDLLLFAQWLCIFILFAYLCSVIYSGIHARSQCTQWHNAKCVASEPIIAVFCFGFDSLNAAACKSSKTRTFFLARIPFLYLVVRAALLSTEDICRHAYIFSFSFHLHGSIAQSAVWCDIRRGERANAMWRNSACRICLSIFWFS